GFDRLLRPPLQDFVVRQAEVVVRAEIEDFLAIDREPRPLRGIDEGDVDQKALFLQGRHLLGDEFELPGHRRAPVQAAGSSAILPHSPRVIRSMAVANSVSGSRWVSSGLRSSSPEVSRRDALYQVVKILRPVMP